VNDLVALLKATLLGLVNFGAAGRLEKSIVNACVAATADPPAPVAVIIKCRGGLLKPRIPRLGSKEIEAVPLPLSLNELKRVPVATSMAVRTGVGTPVVVTKK
jgi:hypothetical protein